MSLISFVETPREIANLMVRLISKSKTCTILDTGCGRGIFLETLLDNDFVNVEGVELNTDLFEFCRETFPKIILYQMNYLTWKPPKKYDLIIGNPPYAHFNSLPTEIQQDVFKITKTREADIYYAFLIKSIDLLKDGGELIYIIPYGFFYNTHAKTVRKKIVENGYIKTIIDLDETRLFIDEHPETIILRFLKLKQEKNSKIEVLRIKNRNARPSEILEESIDVLKNKQENNLFHYHTKQHFNDYKEIWSTFPEIKITEYVKLKNIAYIGVGLVSGFDLAFRIDPGEEQSLNDVEKSMIFKFIKAANCEGFWVNGSVKYILTDEKIRDEGKFSKDLPNFYQRILPYRKKMSTRYLPQNKKWFHWQALRNKTTIEKYIKFPKIFIPTLDRSKVNRFSLTNEEVYPSGDVLCIIPLNVNPMFLLGYLNSNFFREYYLSYGARRGHRVAFTQRIISNIKIPTFTAEIINRITQIAQEILITRDQRKRELINNIIEEAFEQKLFEKTGLLKYI